MSTGVPTHAELSKAAGFPVPESLVRLWKVSAALNPEDPANGFENAGGGIRLFVPEESEEIDDVPCDCVAFASLNDGSQLAFVLDDAADRAIERPIACFTYVGVEPSLYGMSLLGAITYLIRDDSDGVKTDQSAREMLAWLDHLTAPQGEPITDSAIAHARWRQGAVWTPDNIGVIVPEESTDRAFLQRIIWPTPERPSTPKPIVLDEAERRLAKGEIGTALVLARNYWYLWRGGFTEIERTGAIQERVYSALGRRLQAAKIARHTSRALAQARKQPR